MSLGTAYTETTPDSASKKNITNTISGTGTYLATLDKTKHKILVCTETGSGFTVDHVYLCSTDGTEVFDLSDVNTHHHSADASGGALQEIYAKNIPVCDLWLTKTTDLYEASWASPVYWIKTVTGTGSVENKTDGTTGERSIRLRPNGTSGSGSTISYPHMKLAFNTVSSFSTKLQIETATSIALHSGVNCDDVTDADSNTRKYNVEVCTATNNNWWIRSADGTNKSSSDTGIAISANRVGISIYHNPDGPDIDTYIDSNTVFTKTTNIPTTSTSSSNNLIKHSVKNSTGSDRPLLVYGTRLSYRISDNWVGITE